MNQIIGIKVYHFEELDSTNEYAAKLIAKKSPMEGTIVSTDYQTKGKGQYGRKWAAQKNKNITLSVILKPGIEVSHQFYLTMMVSLAIVETLKKYILPNATIKWPNDIYVREKKICGILIQNFISGNNISNSIIGIGLNVNQVEFNPSIPNPTSVAIEAQGLVDLEDIKTALISSLNQYYRKFKQNPIQLKKSYLNAMLGYQEKRSFMVDQEIFSGTIVGVDEIGRLCLKQNEDVKKFTLGEIKMII